MRPTTKPLSLYKYCHFVTPTGVKQCKTPNLPNPAGSAASPLCPPKRSAKSPEWAAAPRMPAGVPISSAAKRRAPPERSGTSVPTGPAETLLRTSCCGSFYMLSCRKRPRMGVGAGRRGFLAYNGSGTRIATPGKQRGGCYGTGLSQLEAYATALADERAAWDAVKGHLPGSSGFDQARWQRWRNAVDEADQAAARARTTIAVIQPARRSPFFRRPWPGPVRLPSILGGTKRAG